MSNLKTTQNPPKVKMLVEVMTTEDKIRLMEEKAKKDKKKKQEK